MAEELWVAPAGFESRNASSLTRHGSVVLPASSATEGELKQIERALMHPPKTVDWTKALVSFAAAVFFAVKTITDANHQLSGWDIIAFCVAIVAAVTIGIETISAWRAKTPFHDAALLEVRKLITMQPTHFDASRQRTTKSTQVVVPATRKRKI